MSETKPEDMAVLLRSYELRLLRCTLPPSPSPSPPPPSDQAHRHHTLHSLISDILVSIEAGRYLDALASPAASRLVFGLHDSPLDDSTECADCVYAEFLGRAESFLGEEENDDGERGFRVAVTMCIAVAAFLGFVQCNMIG